MKFFNYLETQLQDGETIVSKIEFHWTDFWASIAVFLGAVILLLLPNAKEFSVGFLVASFFGFLFVYIDQNMTEIIITQKRLVFKRGWVNIQVVSYSLDKLENVSLKQDLWGRMFDYGQVQINGTGSGLTILNKIKSPDKFKSILKK